MDPGAVPLPPTDPLNGTGTGSPVTTVIRQLESKLKVYNSTFFGLYNSTLLLDKAIQSAYYTDDLLLGT